jgi:hypothetical protein
MESKLPQPQPEPLKPISDVIPSSYRWLQSRKMTRRAGEQKGETITHTVMCARLGPIVITRWTDLVQFYRAVDDDFKKAVPTFFNEEGKPIHILFFDLDLLLPADADWDEDMTASLARDIHRELLGVAYRSAAAGAKWCVAMHTAPTIVRKSANMVYKKVGIHIFWPDIYVDVVHHKKARSVVLRFLEGDSDGDHAQNYSTQIFGYDLAQPWNKILDGDPVVRPKLRIALSNKAQKCDCAKIARTEGKENKCNHFRGNGDAGRLHRIAAVFDADGASMEAKTVELKANGALLLETLSLRKAPDGQQPTPAEWPDNIDQMLADDAEADKSGAADSKTDQRSLLDEKDPRMKLVRDIIHCYFNVQVTNIKLCKKTKQFTAMTNSRLCFNQQREHSNNRTYIVVSNTHFCCFWGAFTYGFGCVVGDGCDFATCSFDCVASCGCRTFAYACIASW